MTQAQWRKDCFLSFFLPVGRKRKTENSQKRKVKKPDFFYRAGGILKDDLSNDTLVYGIRAWKHNGNLHKGIEGLFSGKRTGPPDASNDWDVWRGACRKRKKFIVFENPAVFSDFCSKNIRIVQQSVEMDSQDLQRFFCLIF